MRRRRLFPVAFLLILACCARPAADLSPTPSSLPPTLTPSNRVSSPTATPTLTPTPLPTPPPPDSPLPTPVPARSDHTSLDALLADIPPRPVAYVAVNPTSPRRVPNATRSFWLIEHSTGENYQITARLRVQTSHVAMWVEENVWHDVRALQQAAHYFETQIYTPTRSVFGTEWTPGIAPRGLPIF